MKKYKIAHNNKGVTVTSLTIYVIVATIVIRNINIFKY